jgi:hypothetical protein
MNQDATQTFATLLREGAYAVPKDVPEAGFDVSGGLRV